MRLIIHTIGLCCLVIGALMVVLGCMEPWHRWYIDGSAIEVTAREWRWFATAGLWLLLGGLGAGLTRRRST